MAAGPQTHAESIGELTHLIDRAFSDVAHGRFERSLAGLTAVAAAVTTAEIFLEHYKASFGNKWMWSPIILTPPVMVAGVAGVFSKRWAKTVLPATAMIYTANGLMGEYFHARGVARKPGGWRLAAYNVPMGKSHLRPRFDDARRRHGRPGGPAAAGGLVGRDLSRPDHLPNLRPGKQPPHPSWLPRQRRGTTPQMIGRYPDYDVFDAAGTWDAATARVVDARLHMARELRFFSPAEAPTVRAFCDVCMAQDGEPRVPVVELVDEKLATGLLDGFQYADMPDDRDTWRLVLAGLDEVARSGYGQPTFAAAEVATQEAIVGLLAQGQLSGGPWDTLNCKKAWSVCMRAVLTAFYSHPWAWNEIGFGGPAYPRGFMGWGPPAPGNRSSGPGPLARIPSVLLRSWPGEGHAARPLGAAPCPLALPMGGSAMTWRWLKGSVGPADNDSRFLLDVHRRDLPGEGTMAHYDDTDEVDICIVGAGAGGSVLAQRLARAGWSVVVIEAGPFWHPDEDWVSDEAGSHHLYWAQKRIIGGADPIEMGKNNSGRGVGGSMVHYAGYCPRFHPSDMRTQTLDGVGADWPISYEDIRAHYEAVERELPVAGQDWPWGYPHCYPFSPHPVSESASVLWRGAHRMRIKMRVGTGRHRQWHVRQPPALHLPWVLPAGLQGQRQGQPLRDPLARRPRPRRRDPGQLHGGPGRHRPGQRAGHGGDIRQGRRDPRASAAGQGGGSGGVLHRNPPAAAQLDLRAVPPGDRQRRGPGRPLRHGPGRVPERGALP